MFLPAKEGTTDVEGLYQKEHVGVVGIRLEIREGTAE